ncbi:MAG: efflux RND transporter periplasmic adaptor subunit [Acidobacteriota bacterium]|nr:efflux RND transporter periplasmic adaptor subunit [Blastocatellia bacterium]MDW8239594.1 efflux RND transporter periplasmic adaptor subunit [Acidobacteriota bacterium]
MVIATKKLRRTVWLVVLILIAGLAIGGYVRRDWLRNTVVGRLFGVQPSRSANQIWYCPMHPDYRTDKPGDCPVCNMALVKAEPQQRTTEQAQQEVWYCPMHPDYTSERPGDCPVCNMALVKAPSHEMSAVAEQPMPPGSVQITPYKQQLIGVTYGEVTAEPLSELVRTVGRLTYDESKLSRVYAKFEGYIERVHVDFVGQLVKKGQPLLDVYSPELVATQQELLIAAKAKRLLGDTPLREISSNALSLYDAVRERLRLWDISDAQINEIEQRGAPTKTLTLYSPITGFVVTRNALTGARITPDTELYTIADQSTIWVLADVYEYEASKIRVGQPATITLSYFPGETFHGRVSYINPQLDATTRTLKVRIAIANPQFKLKPEMFANVQLRIDYGRPLSVPQDAVLDSGTQQIVFVAHEGGYFEPRTVQVGPRVNERYIILSGLKLGEKIVTSGNFLIDAESRLKSALSATGHATHQR